jgi:VCBS repeat-containing protein
MSSITSYEVVNVGLLPNDGEGDPLRVAFQKINNNFANLYAVAAVDSFSYTVGNSIQAIFEYPTANFTHGTFQIRSSDTDGNSSQDVTIQAQVNNSNTAVKFTAYSTTLFGNALCRYDMDIAGPNVVLYVQPLEANLVIQHFITSSITWVGESVPGLQIELDGYVASSVMTTENGLIIETETEL